MFLIFLHAGIDPFNRRQVWDMIIQAKAGRSIILTTHFLDEADILSDRIAILSDGKVQTCGSGLFLKHQIAGYKLNFESAEPIDIGRFIDNAEPIEPSKVGAFEWSLQHGTETSFAPALRALNASGATNVSLELTSLEQVFLETGREKSDTESDISSEEREERSPIRASSEQIKNVWEPQGTKTPLSARQKILLVSHFMLTNAWRIKGTIFLNIIQPMLYIIIGMVIFSNVDSDEPELVSPTPITVAPILAGRSPSQFFGLPDFADIPFEPLIPAAEPQSVDDYFREDAIPFLGGFWDLNQTLQYNETLSPFSLQVGVQVLGAYAASINGLSETVSVRLMQLPYTTEPFRVDLLLLPMILAYGFSGLVFSVLDVLLLRSDNIIDLFRVTGVSEWRTYQGVVLYKLGTTFVPFFALVLILGAAFDSILMGNAGRWLGTICAMLGYAYSVAPLGIIFAKRFVKSDFKRAANVFPGLYLTLVSLPYIAWNIALQAAPEARQALLIVGDLLCVIPPVAFQRAIGAIIAISVESEDPDLTWGEVWSWDSRVWFAILVMLFIGTLEWLYLYRLGTMRPGVTPLKDAEKLAAQPVDSTSNFGVAAEKDRSQVEGDGINARELVKLFRVEPPKDAKQRTRRKSPILKSAVKGVSFGIRKGEIFAALGPNGSGKSVTMGILAGTHTPEHGETCLNGKKLTSADHSVEHLFHDGNVSFCPQFDALFPKKTVREHFEYYAKVRGLDIRAESTARHIKAIEHLLGLSDHMDKLSTDISGGFKRRTCLGIAMIGKPESMMVDECTTGMDPNARHLVWSLLKPKLDVEVDLPGTFLLPHGFATSFRTPVPQ